MADSPRTKAEIEAELAAARERLSHNIEGLFLRVHPRSVVSNAMTDTRQVVASQARALKGELVRPDGSLRIDRIGLVAATVAGSVAFISVVRSLFRH